MTLTKPIAVVVALTVILLGSPSAEDIAGDASNVVSDLRSVKAAFLAYFADVGMWPQKTADLDDTQALAEVLERYLARPLDRAKYHGIAHMGNLRGADEPDVVGLVSTLHGPLAQFGVRNKLLADADAAGLVNSDGGPYSAGQSTDGRFCVFVLNLKGAPLWSF